MPQSPDQASSRRVLVVDDEPTSRMKLKRILEEYGRVQEAESAIEAITLFARRSREKAPYNLVTLDVGMPELDGIVTLELMRGLELVHRSLPKAKVLMVTGQSDLERVMATIRLGSGSEGYLLKPVDPNLLVAKVREHFGMPLNRQQRAKLATGPKDRPLPIEKKVYGSSFPSGNHSWTTLEMPFLLAVLA